ncbi:hypothetical protein Ancab_013641 [Ancistrocladus abbreviatus]
MGATMEFEKADAGIAKTTGDQRLRSPSPMPGVDRSKDVTCFAKSSLEVVPDSLENRPQSRPNICKQMGPSQSSVSKKENELMKEGGPIKTTSSSSDISAT